MNARVPVILQLHQHPARPYVTRSCHVHSCRRLCSLKLLPRALQTPTHFTARLDAEPSSVHIESAHSWCARFNMSCFRSNQEGNSAMPNSAEGPCLPHCYCSPLVAGLAYTALAYMGASVIYIAIVALVGFGTPFKDSLSEEQRSIGKRARRNRGAAFAAGILIMVLLLRATRPFSRR